MGKRTKIDWADATWNPVTGCLHGCEYCYARGIANRFGLPYAPKLGDPGMEGAKKYDSTEGLDTMLELDKPYEKNGRKQPYPMGFLPTFHRYKLDEPKRWTKPRTIFVCSMADLFGDWIPAEWICEVFNEARKAPQHRYLFLTKNPERYGRLLTAGLLPNDDNFWYGATWETDTWNTSGGNRCYEVPKEAYNVQTEDYAHRPVKPNAFHWRKVPGAAFFPDIGDRHRFISFEPLLMDVFRMRHVNIRKQWFIIGAETGNRKGKIKPEREWIEHILRDADESRVPVFMKESVRDIMGDDFRQEFPWEVK